MHNRSVIIIISIKQVWVACLAVNVFLSTEYDGICFNRSEDPESEDEEGLGVPGKELLEEPQHEKVEERERKSGKGESKKQTVHKRQKENASAEGRS